MCIYNNVGAQKAPVFCSNKTYNMLILEKIKWILLKNEVIL